MLSVGHDTFIDTYTADQLHARQQSDATFLHSAERAWPSPVGGGHCLPNW
jgi:hypothetical protein